MLRDLLLNFFAEEAAIAPAFRQRTACE